MRCRQSAGAWVSAVPARVFDEESQPPREVWRIWPLNGPSLLLKRYIEAQAYRTEVCNLRFFNAVARDHTPRLLACDDAAHTLLLEDLDGSTVAETEPLGGFVAQRAWERAATTIATIHARSARQMALLRRLYAPHWPASSPAPAADLLEQAMEALRRGQQRPPLTASERGVLIAAGSWLHTRLAGASAHHRMPIIGATSVHDMMINANRVVFTELTQPVLAIRRPTSSVPGVIRTAAR